MTLPRLVAPKLGAAWIFAALLLVSGPGQGAEAPAPRVAASIQPLHSLVSAVMAGLGAPGLLFQGARSPHGGSLTPAQARALSRADLVIWVGAGLETSLAKPLAVLAKKTAVLTASGAGGVALLKGEAGQAPDSHIWLDPRNASAIARAAAEFLARIDPANAARYTENAAVLGERLGDLETELAAILAPVRAAPFMVYHDAYGYFVRRFAMKQIGAVALDPERAPGAKRIALMRARLRETGAACVFVEPQFEPSRASNLVEGTGAKIAVLDPLGAALLPGPDAYFATMRALARSLRACLT